MRQHGCARMRRLVVKRPPRRLAPAQHRHARAAARAAAGSPFHGGAGVLSCSDTHKEIGIACGQRQQACRPLPAAGDGQLAVGPPSSGDGGGRGRLHDANPLYKPALLLNSNPGRTQPVVESGHCTSMTIGHVAWRLRLGWIRLCRPSIPLLCLPQTLPHKLL